MIIIPKWSQCATCAHFRGRAGEEPNERLHCAAFERIPEEIVMNRFDHAEPYDGDHGIQRKPLADGESAAQEVPSQVQKALRAQTRTRIILLQKAGFNPSQPRDDSGRWVRMDIIADASIDDRLADDLRAMVTNPDERSKLDAAIEMFRKGAGGGVGSGGAWVGQKDLTAESLLPRAAISDAEKQRRKAEVQAEIATMLAELPDSEAQVEASDRALELLDNIGWEAEDVAAVVGAPDDAYVHVDSMYQGLGVTVYHDDIKRMYRIIHPVKESIEMRNATEGTALEISNEEFEMADGKGKKGLGGEIFARQVAAASRRGVKRIVTIAAKDEAHDPPLVGYTVWAKLGYDSPIDEVGKSVRRKVEQEFPQARSILDVTNTIQGGEWWTKNGSSFVGAFKLSEKSRSMQRLAAYRLRKQRIAQGREQWTIPE